MKNIIQKILSILLLFFIASSAFAQIKTDTVDLDQITITERKLSYGLKKTNIDSTALSENINSNLSELLSENSPVFIKSYGQGGMATSSFRGAGASHTQVIWNGVNINSPMLGQIDFSLIPVSFIDNVNIYHGGSSPINNSGALGGSISIENKAKWNNKFNAKILQSIGSYNTYNSFASVKAGNNKFQSATRLIYTTSKNDFKFKNNAVTSENYPIEKRQDADYENYGVLQEFYSKINNRNIISLKLWAQNNLREIPQPIVVDAHENNESQKEQFFRSIIEWKRYGNKTKLMVRAAYLYNYFNYQNKISSVNSDNNADSYYCSASYEYIPNIKIKLYGGLNYSYNTVASDNYEELKSRERNSFFGGMNYNITERFSGFLVIRQEIIDNKTSPLTPSLGIEYKLLKKSNLFLKSSLSKTHHSPTLNDMYWYPSGNPNLKDEEGYSGELGLMYSKLFRKINLKTEITYFNSIIKNWILWYPDDDSRYWKPVNLKEVNSKGIEFNLSAKTQLKNTILKINAGYTYTSALNKKTINNIDNAAGKQLIYVPENLLNASIMFEKKTIYCTISTHYTGKRFTTANNNRYMPAYSISDIMAGRNFKLKKYKFCLQLCVNNLFNKDYQAIAWHPMPGRNYYLMLKMEFNK